MSFVLSTTFVFVIVSVYKDFARNVRLYPGHFPLLRTPNHILCLFTSGFWFGSSLPYFKLLHYGNPVDWEMSFWWMRPLALCEWHSLICSIQKLVEKMLFWCMSVSWLHATWCFRYVFFSLKREIVCFILHAVRVPLKNVYCYIFVLIVACSVVPSVW